MIKAPTRNDVLEFKFRRAMQKFVQCDCCGSRMKQTAELSTVRATMWFFNYRPPLQTLLCAALLLLMATSAGSLPVPMSRQIKRQAVNTRDLCWHTNNTCEFYTHCIDSLFHCGNIGFASAYAEGWCEAIRLFHTSTADCSSCLSSSQIDDWAKSHERCFQQRLYQTVSKEFLSRTPDPPTCLQLERRAFQLMEECYSSTSPQLCSALDQSEETESFQSDISKVASAFHVGQYYETTSQWMLSETVKDCEYPESSTIAESILSIPQQRRVVFCGAYKAYGQSVTDITKLNSIFLKKLSVLLSRPYDQFTYEGSVLDDRCSTSAPVGVVPSLDFHFITWRPATNDTLPDNLEKFYSNHSTATNYKFFKYQSSGELCGDGVRQAGEVCDLGVYNGARAGSHTVGCTTTCVPETGYDCTTGQLEYSRCWKPDCGDGRRESGEECDDGNQSDGDGDGDGCSALCLVQPGFHCSTAYNKTSECELLPVTPTPTWLPASSTAIPASSRTHIDPTPAPHPSVPPTSSIKSSSSRSATALPHRLLLLALVALSLTLLVVR